ncbi:MAG: hypothetical protein QOK43_1347 [Acidimicrobiaceae bacterium]|nr:hypothetical protein [Acidimicrobiaceae bacterium]
METFRSGVVYTSTAVLLAVVLVGLLLAHAAVPPPAIAEIAPQAVEQIKDAPQEQASQFGTGAAADGLSGQEQKETPSVVSTTSTLPSQRTGADIEVPRIRHCVGEPSRQTEDPRSPPCANYWDPKNDNGGNTTRGVTNDAISVSLPNWPDPTMLTYFNKRFEFYGRKLVSVGTHAYFNCTPEGQQADAESIEKSDQPFASVFYYYCYGRYFYEEMARRHIVSIATDPVFTTSELAKGSPYMWQYPLALDRLVGTIGEWMCARLKGANAVRAGRSDAKDLSQMTRKFGILTSEGYLPAPDLKPLLQQLETCGATAVQVKFSDTSGDFTTPVLKLKQEDVTSIVCLCINHDFQSLTQAATEQVYNPEWLVSSYLYDDITYLVQQNIAPDQANHILGLSANPADVRFADSWSVKAYAEATGKPWTDRSADRNDTWYQYNNLYQSLLLLASGVQLAGPHLTPESFAAGLQRATFSNPPSPYHEGRVGFLGQSHSMVVDVLEYYYSSSGRSPHQADPPGSICLVDDGKRRAPGAFPPSNNADYTGRCVSYPGG